MKKPVIQTKNLVKKFVDNEVLKGISMSIYERDSLAIIGGSGQGKSIFLKCLTGLIEPDTGEILYEGSLLTGSHKQKLLSTFGVVFQGAALFDSLPIWENISFKFKYLGRHTAKERRQLAIQNLELVGLPKNTLDLYPSELSGGMQKRVGIARALATKPKILFFDEPTAGLDPIMSNTITKLIRNVIRELGLTSITISHDVNSIVEIADKVALLHNGTIEWTGTIIEFKKTKNKKITNFIAPDSS